MLKDNVCVIGLGLAKRIDKKGMLVGKGRNILSYREGH